MNIYVLEDDYVQQNKIKHIIEDFIDAQRYKGTNLFLTAKPDEILDRIETKIGYNIYFLDIEIKNSTDSGFILAQKIRNIDPFGWIVFVTTHSEFLPLTFKKKLIALDFIDKQQESIKFKQAIEECLVVAYEQKHEPLSSDAFRFKNQHSDFQIPFSDILFFETTDITHKIRVVQKNKFSEFYANLSEIENVDQRLFKSHRSYIVNLENVERIDRINKMIYFNNGETCLLSRTKITPIKKRMNEIGINT